jgi:hypothetical protein
MATLGRKPMEHIKFHNNNIQNELSLDGPKSSTYLYFILPKTDILKAGTAWAPEINPVLGGVSVFLCCV